MSVYILANSNEERMTISIKRVFQTYESLKTYVGSLIPVGGSYEQLMERKTDIDNCIADISIKYPDGSLHYYRVFEMDVH